MDGGRTWEEGSGRHAWRTVGGAWVSLSVTVPHTEVLAVSVVPAPSGAAPGIQTPTFEIRDSREELRPSPHRGSGIAGPSDSIHWHPMIHPSQHHSIAHRHIHIHAHARPANQGLSGIRNPEGWHRSPPNSLRSLSAPSGPSQQPGQTGRNTRAGKTKQLVAQR